jgi:hypothetical protein
VTARTLKHELIINMIFQMKSLVTGGLNHSYCVSQPTVVTNDNFGHIHTANFSRPFSPFERKQYLMALMDM